MTKCRNEIGWNSARPRHRRQRWIHLLPKRNPDNARHQAAIAGNVNMLSAITATRMVIGLSDVADGQLARRLRLPPSKWLPGLDQLPEAALLVL